MKHLNIFDFQAYIACFDHLNKRSVTNREGHCTALLYTTPIPNQFLYKQSAICLFNYLLKPVQVYSHIKSSDR